MKSKQLIKIWKNKRHSEKKPIRKFISSINARKNKNLDQIAGNLHNNTFQKLDCLDCANCCTSIPPIVSRSDAKRLAKAIGISDRDFTQQYLIQDEDGDWVMKKTPCPFLQSDNKCSVYDVRPKACRKYPHTDADEFRNNLGLHAGNAHYCPAVFHILQDMMKIV